MTIAVAIVYVLAGVLLLGFGANRFVVASAEVARYFKLSPLVAGVLLVGFGGSFPEIIVSTVAALHGQMSMAVGNAIGSNIVNIGLVLGGCALIAPMLVNRHCLVRDFPILAIVMLLTFGLIFNGYLSTFDGSILLLAFIYYVGYMLYMAKRHPEAIAIEEVHVNKPVVLWQALLWWLIALAVLFVSSELLVNGASAIAKYFGVSDLVIGLTVVAIGTSLPEFSITLMAAINKQHDIALGNVLGSNVFNLLAVLAMPALIAPGALEFSVIRRDFPFMVAITLLAWLMIFVTRASGYRVTRWAGCILLLSFIGYYGVIAF